jgi:hypothetical protein
MLNVVWIVFEILLLSEPRELILDRLVFEDSNTLKPSDAEVQLKSAFHM